MKFVASTKVASDTRTVLAVLTQPDLYLQQWSSGVLAVTKIDEAENAYLIISRDLAGKTRLKYRISPSAVDGRFHAVGRGDSLSFSETYVLSEVDGHSTISFEQDVAPRGLFRIVWPLISFAWPLVLQKHLHGLKRFIETRADAEPLLRPVASP